MPNIIKDEEKWEKAKDAVIKEYHMSEKNGDQYWRLVMGVYKKMKGTFNEDSNMTTIGEILSEATSPTASKRKKIEGLVIDTLEKMDKSGYNGNRYKDFFKSMSDAQFTKFMKDFLGDESQNFYLEVIPFEKGKEPLFEDVQSAAKYLGVPLNEYMYLPFANPDGEPLRTAQPVPVGLNCSTKISLIAGRAC